MLEQRFKELKRTPAPDLWPDIEGRDPGPPRAGIPWGRLGTAAVALAVAAAGFAVATQAFFGEEAGREPIDRLAGPAENGLIATGGGGRIYVMQPDGSGLRELFPMSGGQDLSPWEWSPDGSHLVLQGYVVDPNLAGGNQDIYVVNSDGTGLRNLTMDPSDVEAEASQGEPTWSPGGKRLAFADDRGADETRVIQVIDVNGSGRRTITDPASPSFTPDPSSDAIQAYRPQWSPDGSRISFDRYLRDGSEIYSVAPDGSDLRLLTEGNSWNFASAWSPDGSRIAFVSNRTGTNEIFVMEADGSDEQQLTDIGAKNVGDPQWSPDGARLVFDVLSEGDWDIWTVKPDGTGATPLTDGPGDEVSPVWAPDGTRIAYEASPIPNEAHAPIDIYTMNPDGGDVQRLTDDGQWGFGLAWQPVSAPHDSGLDQPSPSSPALLDPEVTATVELGGARGVAFGAGSLWVAVWEEGSGRKVVRMDPESGEVFAEIPVEALTSWEVHGQGMATTSEAVWVVGHRDGRVLLQRIDLATNRVEDLFDLASGYAADVAADEQGVWVTLLQGHDLNSPSVLRVDPATGEVVATIPLDQEWVRDVLIVGSYVFVHQQNVRGSGGFRESSLVRIDPATNRIVDELPAVESTIEVPLVWEDQIWATQGYVMTQIDPVTNSYAGDPVPVDHVGLLFSAGAGGLWFSADAKGAVEVRRLNTATRQVDASVELPENANPVDMVVAEESIWIVDYRRFLTRIDLT